MTDSRVANRVDYMCRRDQLIRGAGAATTLFMTWPLQYRPRDISTTASVYRSIGAEISAGVALVGLAWGRPGWKALTCISSSWHPNQRGTYLAACVRFATITGVSPIGLCDAGFSPIPKRDIEDLQRIAASTTGTGRIRRRKK